MSIPALPNALWIASTKMPGWAICFGRADEANFLRFMQTSEDGARWEPRDRLTAEELVTALRKPELESVKPIVQQRLDEMHAHLREEQERGQRALDAYRDTAGSHQEEERGSCGDGDGVPEPKEADRG